MKSIADQLPAEIARQIHPDWRRNEAEYWAARDQLLSQYQGQWIGFADGVVIVSGTSPVEVLHAAQQSGRHPFIICVGREEEPCRIRRSTFPYDTSYPGEPLPLIGVEFRQVSGSPGMFLDRVIPDTGADASVLPWADCQLLQLVPSLGVPGVNQWYCWWFRCNDRFFDLGLARWTGISMPIASGLCWRRTHPWPRRSQSFGNPVPWSCR